MKVKQLCFLLAGITCLALGTVGILLPFLPTVPFYMATVFCFAKSSQKLHTWFLSTKLYKNHLESYVKKQGMTLRTKLTVIITVTLLMGFGFAMMMRVPAAQALLCAIWLGHILYFVFRVKTIPEQVKNPAEDAAQD